MPFPSVKGYKTEEELKTLEKIRKARDEGDKWFREYYLKGVATGDKFRIHEITENDVKRLDEGIKNFLPYACRKCDFDGQISRRIFKMEIAPRNKPEWKQLRDYMKRKYKIEYFRVQRGIGINVIMAAECPQCESQDVLFDYMSPSQQKEQKKHTFF